MTMRRSPFLLTLTASLLVALAVVYFGVRRRQTVSARLQRANQEGASLSAELTQLERALLELEKQRAGLDLKESALREKSPDVKPTPAAVYLSDLNLKHPELLRLWSNRQRAAYSSIYYLFFIQHHLTSEQMERLKTIKADWSDQREDICGSARAQGISTSDDSVVALLRQTDERAEAAENALLGENGAKQLKEYARAERPRQLVYGLATAVAATAPLSVSQASQLTSIIAEATPSYQAGGEANTSDVDWELVDKRAQAILSPLQFAAWRNADPKQNGLPSRTDWELQSALDRIKKDDHTGFLTEDRSQ